MTPLLARVNPPSICRDPLLIRENYLNLLGFFEATFEIEISMIFVYLICTQETIAYACIVYVLHTSISCSLIFFRSFVDLPTLLQMHSQKASTE